MLNPSKLNEMRKVAKNPTESQYVQALVTIIVELEHAQLDAVMDLHDAQGIDGIEVTSTREDRREALLGLASAVADGDLKRYWFENVVAEHVEDVEDVLPYAGLGTDEWETKIEDWAGMYRREAPEAFADDNDREIAAQHVRDRFGVSLDAFEREVINYSRKDALQTSLASNFQSVETGIRAAEATARKRETGEDAEGDR